MSAGTKKYYGTTVPISRWHPKLTLYRILVLSTTIGLGSVKAYATFQGLIIVSTTIEWLTGVVLFSLLFLLGLFETSPPRLLSWLLAYDLMDLTWMLFRKFSLTTPQYRTDEKEPNSHMTYPPITGYRLLTSVSVISFGVNKAYHSYQGLSGDLNAVDWASGVAITSSLYIIGLYENNTVNLMPNLFSSDYSSAVFEGSIITSHITGMLSSIPWSKKWLQSMVPPWPNLLLYRNPSNAIECLGNIGLYVYVQFGGCVLAMSAGVMLFIVLFRHLLYRYDTSPTVRRMKKSYQTLLNLSLALAFPVTQGIELLPASIQNSLFCFFRFIRRFTIHIIVYLFCSVFLGGIACVTFSFIPIAWSRSVSIIDYYVAAWASLIIVFPFVLASVGCIACLWLAIRPFWTDWESPTYERTLFEF